MNPHREVSQQVGYLSDDDFCADYYLTQIVSHHSLDRVEAFLEECARQGVETPGIFGVFTIGETIQRLWKHSINFSRFRSANLRENLQRE